MQKRSRYLHLNRLATTAQVFEFYMSTQTSKTVTEFQEMLIAIRLYNLLAKQACATVKPKSAEGRSAS